ncbi:MAG: peptidylprolyl isomerase, partial [Hyphomicrobiales bacterium]
MAFNTLVHAKDVLVLETSKGTVEIEFLPNVAPKHVAQVSKLAKSGFYNGIVFHRVIEGFMAQTGDPTGTGTGGSKEPNINAEFSITPFDRGVV